MKKLIPLLLALALSLSMMVPALAAADGPGGILLGSWDGYLDSFKLGGQGSVLSGGTLRIVLAVAILAAAAVVIVICKKKKN